MFVSRISKVLTVGVLSLTLVMTSLAPTPARAGLSDDEVMGLLTILLLGGVIHNQRDNRTTREPIAEPRRDWRVLPANCIRSFTRQNGRDIRIFAQRCLRNAGVQLNRLPADCHVRVRNENGQRRQGYRVRCMRNQGFRTNQR